MKEYAVNGDVLQKILTYLAGRPYVEVHELVKGLQSTSRELPGSNVSPVGEATGTGDIGPSTSNGSGTAHATSA